MLQVPVGDNYYAALNSAVFSDGSFVYIPKVLSLRYLLAAQAPTCPGNLHICA